MTSIHEAYHYNPLNDTALRQIAFLFGKAADFLDQSAMHREEGNFEEFANMLQRSIALMQGLSDVFDEALPYDLDSVPKKALKGARPHTWNDYFIVVLQGISALLQNYTSAQSTQISKNLRDMENLWVESHYQMAEKCLLEEQKTMDLERLTQSEIDFDAIDDAHDDLILLNELTLGRDLNMSL